MWLGNTKGPLTSTCTRTPYTNSHTDTTKSLLILLLRLKSPWVRSQSRDSHIAHEAPQSLSQVLTSEQLLETCDKGRRPGSTFSNRPGGRGRRGRGREDASEHWSQPTANRRWRQTQSGGGLGLGLQTPSSSSRPGVGLAQGYSQASNFILSWSRGKD